MSEEPTFPAGMPAKYIRNQRPVGAISHGTSYLVDLKDVALDRDGGTWVKATATASPLKKHIQGYIALRREEDRSLLMFGFDDPYLTFALTVHKPLDMKRKGFVPVHRIDPLLMSVGEHVPESEHDEYVS